MKEPPTILACVVAISPGTLRTNVWVFRRAEVAAGRKNLKCGRHKSWHDTFNEISMLCQTVDCLLYLPLTLTILTIWQSSRSAFNEIIQRQLQLPCWRFCDPLFCFFFTLLFTIFFFSFLQCVSRVENKLMHLVLCVGWWWWWCFCFWRQRGGCFIFIRPVRRRKQSAISRLSWKILSRLCKCESQNVEC